MPDLPNVSQFQPPLSAAPPREGVERAAALLRNAKSPVILPGRVSRDVKDWARRVSLVEALNAEVLTDIKIGASFPTNHRLHRSKPAFFLDEAACDVLRKADVILSLDWLDLAGALKQAKRVDASIIHVSLDYQLHNGWGMEHQGLPRANIHLACAPDVAMHAIADELDVAIGSQPQPLPVLPAVKPVAANTPLDIMSFQVLSDRGLRGYALRSYASLWDGRERHGIFGIHSTFSCPMVAQVLARDLAC